MKKREVLEIKVNGRHFQYLLKSEVRFILNIVREAPKDVTVSLVWLDEKAFKFNFGK